MHRWPSLMSLLVMEIASMQIVVHHNTTYHCHWFTTFEPMAIGRMKVHVAGNHTIWVEGHGDVQILTYINGERSLGY